MARTRIVQSLKEKVHSDPCFPIGGAVGEGTGAATALDGTKYNYLTHEQRDQKKRDIASCGADQTCISDKDAQWTKVSNDQNLAMGYDLIDQGVLPAGLANQLRSTDPSSAAYVALLSQAVGYGSNVAMNYALVNERDGEPMIGASTGGWDSQARAGVEMGLILPFAAPAAGALAATGAALTVPAATAWGGDAFAAYRAATAGYSLGAAAASGALGSGAIYMSSNLIGAGIDASRNDTAFAQAFDQRFSYWGLSGSMAIGAAGGMYQTQMFQWAGVPNTFANWLTPAGAVIRINKTAAGVAAGKATQATLQESQRNDNGTKR